MNANDPHDPLPPITEKQLARLWERRAVRSRALRTERGNRIRVLYPGRPGVTAGPDFRNALLLVEDQGLVQGDVEVHLRQQDWRSHGHHADPNYNGVALHVALETTGAHSSTASGGEPPLVGLRGLLDDPRLDETPAEARDHLWRLLEGQGYRRPDSAERMAALLNRAGDERFLGRSRVLQRLMSEQPPEQTLWESICEALGYRHNQHAFLQLAIAAPIHTLENMARRVPESERNAVLSAALLGLAGFGEYQRPNRPRRTPEKLGPRLDAAQWKLFRVRPSNHPRRRVAGAAALLIRFVDDGLLHGLARAAAAGNPSTLTEALSAGSGAEGGAALIGAGRARDIAVNAVLPFLHGLASLTGEAGKSSAMLELYRKYGKLTENEITRELTSALQPAEWGRVARTARQQQGLIHLQRLLAGAANPRR
ncbi:MAG: DUF2851 family protein [Chloroflexota bacterium]|nr:DUF2851 family protein [Chloroflexota bacterium]MDE2959095.1 DUF2851 family protein [Chloroflexota bacterium]